MNLYRVQGGLGHNFPISAFEDTGSINAATPVSDGSFLFMAGLRVGMPDQFTYTLDGDLSIKTGGQDAGARFDFHSWLLKPADNSNGDFQGFLQYAGSNFDGRLWGHLNFLGGIASVDMGNSASNAAVDIHLGPSRARGTSTLVNSKAHALTAISSSPMPTCTSCSPMPASPSAAARASAST